MTREPVSTVPVLATNIFTTVLESLSTSTFEATRTNTVYDVSAQTTTIDGQVLATATTVGVGIEIFIYPTSEVSTVSLTSQTVVVSTVGFSTIYASVSSTQISSVAPPTNTSTIAGSNQLGESSDGLTQGQKSGIGIGVPLGVVSMMVLLILYLRWKKRRKARAASNAGSRDREDDLIPESSPNQGHPSLMPEMRNPEEVTHPAYEMPNPRLSHPSTMSGTTYHRPLDDEPLYLGIPSHLSGEKRWSKERPEEG